MLRQFLVLSSICVLSGIVFAAPPGKGKTNYSLSLNIAPASISELGGTAQATVSHNNTSTGSSVVIALSSNDTTEATVPASVTIPAGSSSKTFTINSVNDTIMDGNQLVTIGVSASSYTNASASLTVIDDDGPNFNYLLTYIDPPYLTKGIFLPHANIYGQFVSSFYINDVAGDRQTHGFFSFQGVSEDLNDWVAREITEEGLGIPEGWIIATATGINDRGAIVGALSPIGNPDVRSGYVLDTAANPPRFHVLPDESLGNYTYPLRINDNGDVAGRIRDADGLWSLYLFNCGIYEPGDANIADTILPMIPAGSTGNVQINNASVLSNTQIAGDYRYIDATGSAITAPFIYTKGEASSLTLLDIVDGKPIDTVVDINDWGIMLGHHTQETLLKGNKARYDHSNYYLTATSAELLPGLSDAAPNSLNNSGDVLSIASVYQDEWGTTIKLSDLIVGDPDSLLAWSMAEQDPSSKDNHAWSMTNRVNITGDLNPDAGIITGYTGPRGFVDGKPRHFILTPVPAP